MMGLTKPQSRLLAFIASYTATQGYAPNWQDMQQAMGLASKSSVTKLVDGLEQRGRIRRIPNRHRAIEIIERGELAHFSIDELMAEIGRRVPALVQVA